MDITKQIAIYGKGGIGKSTIASNLSMAFTKMGKQVMQVGCDPKGDSVRLLTGGKRINTVLEVLNDKLKHGESEETITLTEIIHKGSNGVLCVESGGPEPGVGCAGRGIIKTVELLRKIVFPVVKLDVVIYDVLGDVVCGGFAVPIRMGYAKEVYVVTSGEFLSLYATNNIFKGIQRYALRGGAKAGGLILNCRGVPNELNIVKEFSKKSKVKIIGVIPRNTEVFQECERKGKTVLELFPRSNIAKIFKRIAEFIWNNKNLVIPTPIPLER